MKNKLLLLVEHASNADRPIPKFEVGDTVDVHQRILEGTKERTQVYSGVVIARRGEGHREMFTVRRIVAGEGVERIFPINSPRIAKIEVKRSGVTRRAKLFYLRDRVGKATKLRERKGKVEVPESPTQTTTPSTNGTAPVHGAAGTGKKASKKAKSKDAAKATT